MAPIINRVHMGILYTNIIIHSSLSVLTHGLPAMAVTYKDMPILYNGINGQASILTPDIIPRYILLLQDLDCNAAITRRPPAQDADHKDAIKIKILSDLQQWCVIREIKAQMDCMSDKFRLLGNQEIDEYKEETPYVSISTYERISAAPYVGRAPFYDEKYLLKEEIFYGYTSTYEYVYFDEKIFDEYSNIIIMTIKENNGLKQDKYVSPVIWLLLIIISILSLILIRLRWSKDLLIRLLGGSSYPTPGGQEVHTTPYDENYEPDSEEADIEQAVSSEEIDTDEDERCFRRQLKYLNIMKLTPTYVCYNIRYIISDINYFRKRRNNEENADKLSEIFFPECAVAECAVADEKDISDITLFGILKPINILDIILIVGRQWFILNWFKKQKVMVELLI